MLYILILLNFLFAIDYYTGRIVNQEGNPLTGANIHIVGTNDGTTSDSEGYFTIDLNGPYSSVKITYIGYAPKLVDLELQNDDNIILYPKSLNSDEITITGLRRKSYIKNTPVMTRVISSEDIENSGVTSVKDLLEVAIPNIQNVMSSHAGISNNNVKLQGLDNRYMLFLVDGNRVSGEFAGNLDFNMLNLSNVGRVEVVEGGMSSIYGSSAIAGVVNIISKKNYSPFSFNYSYIYDDPMITSQNCNINLKVKDFSYNLNLVKERTDGYDLTPHSISYTYPLKTLEQYETKTIGQNLSIFLNNYLSFDLKWKRYENQVYQYQNHFVQVLDNQNVLYPNYYYTSYRFNMPQFKNNEYSIKLNYDNNYHHFVLKYHFDKYIKGNYFFNYTNEDCDNMNINYYCNNDDNLQSQEFINAENYNKNIFLKYDLKFKENNFFTIGFEENHNKYSSFNIYNHLGDNNNDGQCGTGTPWDPNDCLVQSIFGGHDDVKIYNKKAFFLGSQSSFNGVDILSISVRNIISNNFGDKLIYSAAYLIKDKLYNYRINYSRGFRIPSIKELYYDFQSHPPPILGNPDLKSTINNYFSISMSNRNFNNNSSIEVYYNDVKDMIGISYADTDNDGQDDILLYDNFKKVIIMGLNYHYEYLDSKNSAKFVYNYTNPISNNLDPKTLISMHSFNIKYSRIIVPNKISLILNTKFSGEKFTVYNSDKLVLDDYFITSAFFSFKVGKYIKLNLGCKNIFDYVDDRSRLDDDYLRDILTTYDPGRRYFIDFKFSYQDFSR